MKILLKQKQAKEVEQKAKEVQTEQCSFVLKDTLSKNTCSYVDIEMEEGETITKKNGIIYSTSILQKE